jgi:hypothetical protein
MPASSAANLTSIPAANITGTLPAISGASLINTGGLKSIQVFTSSGTWTKPSGINTIKVYCTGGGGGGGGNGTGANDAGAGGAAGGTAIKIYDVSSTSSVVVTCGGGGAAGTGDNNGATGGTSSFPGPGQTITATGGMGGRHGNNYARGTTGGVGAGGTMNLRGGVGEKGMDQAVIIVASGCGGCSIWGGAGQGGGYYTGEVSTAGIHGGGGGSGMYTTQANAGEASSAGGVGIIVIEEYA